MAYRRYNNNDRRNSRSNSYEKKDYVPNKETRPPSSDGNDRYDSTIEQKVMKGLPWSAYGMKVDPYTEANNPSTPYSFLAAFNRVFGGRYAGDDNLGGGNLIQYNNSVTSKFLKIFDCAMMSIGLNYRYLPILATDTVRGAMLVDEMRKAISEVVSSLSATTFKDQNIYYYVVETTLPMGSAKSTMLNRPNPTPGGNPIPTPVYTDIADVIYAMCMEYQLVLQNLASVVNMFSANRTRMGVMIRMSWDREVAVLNSFFGLLKKKSFLAIFDSLSMNIAGEYFDTEWMAQANTFCLAASRRSNCINDPVLEISATHRMPSTFRTYIANNDKTSIITQAVYDFDQMSFTLPGDEQPTTFMQAIKKLQVRLTITDTLDWARNVARGSVNENDRFNEMKAMVDVLTAVFTYFKQTFVDLRTVLTIMARVGVVRWKLGVKLNITQDTDTELTQFLVVDNIYKECFSGSPTITYNDTTKRWRTHTMWNLYYGVPEYAMKSGGAFFTFSLKEFEGISGITNSNIGYIPVAFGIYDLDAEGNFCVTIARDGTKVFLGRDTITMSNDEVFARLVPLASQNELELTVPKPTTDNSWVDPSGASTYRSFLYKLMLQIAGVGESYSGDMALDPDTVSVYEYEIEDFTNEMIAYCRGNGPFQVSVFSDTKMGFYGLVQSHK